ncbi:unnamed protein product [Dovyalis caffra]|uniref:Alpha/beta hydrolase fold-3 domain-containing protein n=1 Tax=Dovyalis caffra TaxID=77055 RepID=A0AAV1RN33_9ROSI|nr:unnamed protein product [Dovyalis caffra]
MWNLALPSGVDRDHEYCNPMVDGGSKLWENLRLLGWKVMVTGCDGDPMIDRQIEFVNMLVTRDVKVLSHFSEGGYHVVELKEPSKAKTLLDEKKSKTLIEATLTNLEKATQFIKYLANALIGYCLEDDHHMLVYEQNEESCILE